VLYQGSFDTWSLPSFPGSRQSIDIAEHKDGYSSYQQAISSHRSPLSLEAHRKMVLVSKVEPAKLAANMMCIPRDDTSSVPRIIRPAVYKEDMYDHNEAGHRPSSATRVPLSALEDRRMDSSLLDSMSRPPHGRQEVYQHGAVRVVIETCHRSSGPHKIGPLKGSRCNCLPSGTSNFSYNRQPVHFDGCGCTRYITKSGHSHVAVHQSDRSAQASSDWTVLGQEEMFWVPHGSQSNTSMDGVQLLPHISSVHCQSRVQLSRVRSAKSENRNQKRQGRIRQLGEQRKD